VHVVDDRGIDVDTVCTKADADGQPTNAHGTAVFKEVSAGEHAVALDTALSAKLLERYEALTESTSRTVTVAPGQVAYVPYQLTRKPELSVLVVQKNKPEKRFDDADVQVTGPVNVSDRTKKGTGRIDFGCLPAGPYSITVALASTDAKTFATTLDFATTAEKATLSAPGEKRLVTVEAEPINIVTSHVGIKKTELTIDHGPDDFESETTCITLSLKQTNDEHRYDGPLTLTCVSESSAAVDAFWNEECSKDQKIAGPLNEGFLTEAKQKDLHDGKTVELYVRAARGPGKIRVALELEPLESRFITFGDLAPPVEATIKVLARPHVNIVWMDGRLGVDKVQVKLASDGSLHSIPESIGGGCAKWAGPGITPGRYDCAFTFPDKVKYLLYNEDGMPVDAPFLELQPGGKPVTYQIKKGQVKLAVTCETAGQPDDVKVQVTLNSTASPVRLEQGKGATPVDIPYTKTDQQCEIETFTPDGNDVYEMEKVESEEGT
jgi:hypothetical protein